MKNFASAYATKRKLRTSSYRPETPEIEPEIPEEIPDIQEEELNENTQKVDLSAIIKKHRFFASKE